MEFLKLSMDSKDSKDSDLFNFEGYVTLDNEQSFANLKHVITSKNEFNTILKNLCQISQFNVNIYSGMQHREARKSYNINFNNDSEERDNLEDDCAG